MTEVARSWTVRPSVRRFASLITVKTDSSIVVLYAVTDE